MALGASAGDVVRLVIAEGMRPALTGVLLGAFGAFALGGVLSKLIYGVSAADPHHVPGGRVAAGVGGARGVRDSGVSRGAGAAGGGIATRVRSGLERVEQTSR